MSAQFTLSVDEQFENFTYMIIEEFLKKKGMFDTLDTFREELVRPVEEKSLLSWYDVALKLRLPDLITSNRRESSISSSQLPSRGFGESATILENIVFALTKESCVRNRRPMETTLRGLALEMTMGGTGGGDTGNHGPTFPTELLHDSVYEGDEAMAELERIERENQDELLDEEGGGGRAGGIGQREDTGQLLDIDAAHPGSSQAAQKTEKTREKEAAKRAKQRAQRLRKEQLLALVAVKNKDVSSENWMPEEARMKSIGRNFTVAQECLANIQKREMIEAREMKNLSVSELGKAKVKESLGSLKKIPCGCCQRNFLDVNLPLKVSKKAIMDIKIVWSGGLNSKTVFGGSPIDEKKKKKKDGNETDGDSDTELDNGSPHPSPSPGSSKKAAILTRLGCYEQASVCIFCAQFFSKQEDYRPSYATITYEERKAVYLENKRKEKEYWDPLKMMEKDRAALEKRQSKLLLGGLDDGGEEDSLSSTTIY